MSEKRTRKFNIAFFPEEFDRVQEFAQKSDLTTSEFIREAIRNKIRIIEHPEYNGVIKEVKSDLDTQKSIVDKQNRDLNVRLGDLTKKMSQLREIANQSRRHVYRSELNQVIDILETKGEATLGEIQKLTKIDKEALSKILTDHEVFSINIKGKYTLKGIK